LGQIEAFRPTWVGWKHSDLSQSNLEKLQEAGFRVALWTVNKTSDARPWIARGVDAIITDVPAVMLGLLEEGAPKP
jgi:glycerophosphoryl diester phosphodiesterase